MKAARAFCRWEQNGGTAGQQIPEPSLGREGDAAKGARFSKNNVTTRSASVNTALGARFPSGKGNPNVISGNPPGCRQSLPLFRDGSGSLASLGETAALAESGLNHTAVVPLNEVTAPEPETCAAFGLSTSGAQAPEKVAHGGTTTVVP